MISSLRNFYVELTFELLEIPVASFFGQSAIIVISILELPVSQLLQPALPGSVHCLCSELHPALLQGQYKQIRIFAEFETALP